MIESIKIEPGSTEVAILIGVKLPNIERWEAEEYINELEQLVNTAGAKVVDKFIQEKDRVDAKYFIGRGKVDELHRAIKHKNANMVVFDDDLISINIFNNSFTFSIDQYSGV